MHDLQQQLVANEMESKIRYEKIINDMKDQFRYVSDSNEKKVDVLETTLKFNIEKVQNVENELAEQLRLNRLLKRDKTKLESEV